MVTNPTVRRLSIAALFLAAISIDVLTAGTSVIAYAIPVAAAAVLEGWVGALILAVAAAGSDIALASYPFSIATVLDSLSLIVLACALVMITSQERKLRLHYQQVAGRLSGVYEKVQANFEGMKRAERLSAIGQLSAGFAHEIRNPLASISGSAAILARSLHLEPKNAKCLEIIQSECARLDRLLTDFLNFARPRAPRLQTISLEPLLENVLELASHGVRGNKVRLEKRIEVPLQPVECDPEQLEQVLLNLMINAIEASPQDGGITLAAGPAGANIAIDVVDHGHGVAPAHVDRLFDPFFTTKANGTGLGLPVAHQIVRQMGGSLLVRANDDQGMTFSVVLPCKDQPA